MLRKIIAKDYLDLSMVDDFEYQRVVLIIIGK